MRFGPIEINGRGSNQVNRGNNSDNHHDREDGGPQFQTLFDDLARAIAVAVAHERHDEEARAAREK